MIGIPGTIDKVDEENPMPLFMREGTTKSCLQLITWHTNPSRHMKTRKTSIVRSISNNVENKHTKKKGKLDKKICSFSYVMWNTDFGFKWTSFKTKSKRMNTETPTYC